MPGKVGTCQFFQLSKGMVLSLTHGDMVSGFNRKIGGVKMDSQFLVLTFVSVASLLCAFLLERARANRLALRESLGLLVGTCFVSRVQETRTGLELTLKTNKGKFCHTVAANHAQLADLKHTEGKLVAVSLGEAGELHFELVYEVRDSLELLLQQAGKALQEAADEWPLEGSEYQNILRVLANIEGPLDADRVKRALIFWERHYAAHASIAEALVRTRIEMRRQKLYARMSRALAK